MSHRFCCKSFLKVAFSLASLAFFAGCATPTPRDSYVVFFQKESVQLDNVGQEVVKQAAESAHKKKARHIYVLGSAGKAGDPDALRELATKRALAVVELLEIDGIDPKLISKDRMPIRDVDDSSLAYRRVSIKVVK